MSGSLNKVQLIGNLGADPEIRALGDGAEVANLRLATTESWRDRASGERKEKTEWHRISVFGDGLVNVVKNYLRKGSKIYVEGSLQTRSYEKDGQTQYATEIVLRGFGASLVMLDGKGEGDAGGGNGSYGGQTNNGSQSRGPAPQRQASPAPAMASDGFDDVPF